ncbi:DUF2768 family protein [uncultured Aquimarina sp.]|uniref:DUF2768 family protein n=1 Tax=uncultured Aquimarina sp. TaxID=575652 RepID=UPI003417CC50
MSSAFFLAFLSDNGIYIAKEKAETNRIIAKFLKFLAFLICFMSSPIRLFIVFP